MTFVFISEFGETLDLALHLKDREHQDVLMFIKDGHYKKIGDGLVEKIDDWHECIGQGYIFVFDGCSQGKTQDWLRSQGEWVFGGSELGDELENDRQKGQALFKKAGFFQPPSKNFKDIDQAIAAVKANKEKRWILKQNGDAPKSLNHMGKFKHSVDMLAHLEDLKTEWNEEEYGKFDCDLMEVVDGTEVAASAFWNGHDWMRDAEGKVVGYLNWEEKKEASGGLGVVCGEMGTTFLGVNEDNALFKDIILRPAISTWLKSSGFRGVFDINGSQTKDGYVAFEPTMRFGIPSTAYEFCEGLDSRASNLLAAVAKGEDEPVRIQQGLGMVMVVAAPPFPVEAHIPKEDTSIGERLWLLDRGEPSQALLKAPKYKHIHPYNFFLDEEDNELKAATDSGYMLTVTARGDSVESLQEKLVEYIKDNLSIHAMKYREDIGDRAKDFIERQV